MTEAILIGVDRVFPSHYGDYFGLDGPEGDIRVMRNICRILKIQSKEFFGKDAISKNVVNSIKEAAKHSSKGDLILIYYSGHGTQFSAGPDETDGLNESWCLPDRCLIDNEINSLLSEFKTGVRILVISDSCHSGTIPKINNQIQIIGLEELPHGYHFGNFKEIEEKTFGKIYLRNKNEYDTIIQNHIVAKEVKASVLYLGACKDNEKARDGKDTSTFTCALNKVWNYGNFDSNYSDFTKEITRITVRFTMNPVLDQYGHKDDLFLAQKPFQI